MELRYEQVCKRFGTTDALIDLDLHAPDGCFLAMLGPSGCGKTTALRLLAGLEEPTSGRMYIGPREVTHLHPRDRDIAMVFQSYALYPHKTVEENIDYPLRIRGRVSKESRRERIDNVVRMLNIEAYLGRYPRQLSGGQRQRVALARAIVRQPQAFLMDEPLSNLDAQLRFQMRAELKRLQKSIGVTTVYVTHDQLEAMTMADLIAVMSAGRLQQLATPAEIYARPANLFVAGFCGSPPMNLLDGTVANGRFIRAEGSVPVGDGPAAERTVLGFRPEHAQITMRGSADSFTGEIYVVEPLGNETLVSVKAGDDRINVRAAAGFRGQIGDECGVRPDAGRTVLFSKDSGNLIRGTADGSSHEPRTGTVRESA
jgi:multiple sugar transport system ATP-binding protein